MTWDNLKASRLDFGGEQSFLMGSVLKSYNAWRLENSLPIAESIDGIFYEEAKAELKRDLEFALQIDLDDAAELAAFEADILTPHEAQIRAALAVLQIRMVYDNDPGSIDDLNHLKWRDYARRYQDMKSAFPNLRTTHGGDANVRSIPMGI